MKLLLAYHAKALRKIDLTLFFSHKHQAGSDTHSSELKLWLPCVVLKIIVFNRHLQIDILH